MITLKKYGRTWHIYGDESLLEPWAENIEQIQGDLIKQNKKRSVWHVVADDDNDYFIKHERKFHFPFTASKAKKEYQAYALLEKKGIPCAECSAWSSTLHDSILVTRALPETFCSLLKFWYMKQEVNLPLLQKLCDFLADIAHAGIYHPDFHAGNLMTDGESIVIIDPVGIKDISPDNSLERDMLVPLELTFGEVPLEQVAEMLHSSGLFSSIEETRERLQRMNDHQMTQVKDTWEKRRNQILSGTSKFATEVEPGKFFRNSAWFSPVLKHPNDIFEEKIFPESEAVEIWVNSFRAQLLKEKLQNIPVIYEKIDQKVKISFLKEKKYSFFYGFR